jgi:hypothetical protein
MRTGYWKSPGRLKEALEAPQRRGRHQNAIHAGRRSASSEILAGLGVGILAAEFTASVVDVLAVEFPRPTASSGNRHAAYRRGSQHSTPRLRRRTVDRALSCSRRATSRPSLIGVELCAVDGGSSSSRSEHAPGRGARYRRAFGGVGLVALRRAVTTDRRLRSPEPARSPQARSRGRTSRPEQVRRRHKSPLTASSAITSPAAGR